MAVNTSRFSIVATVSHWLQNFELAVRGPWLNGTSILNCRPLSDVDVRNGVNRPASSVRLEEPLDCPAGRCGGLGAPVRHRDRRGGIGDAYGLLERLTVSQRDGEGSVEDIAGGGRVYGLHLKAGDEPRAV